MVCDYLFPQLEFLGALLGAHDWMMGVQNHCSCRQACASQLHYKSNQGIIFGCYAPWNFTGCWASCHAISPGNVATNSFWPLLAKKWNLVKSLGSMWRNFLYFMHFFLSCIFCPPVVKSYILTIFCPMSSILEHFLAENSENAWNKKLCHFKLISRGKVRYQIGAACSPCRWSMLHL